MEETLQRLHNSIHYRTRFTTGLSDLLLTYSLVPAYTSQSNICDVDVFYKYRELSHAFESGLQFVYK